MTSPILAQLRRRGLTIELSPDGDVIVTGHVDDRATAETWLAARAGSLRSELLAEKYANAGIVVAAKLALGGQLTIRDTRGQSKPARIRWA
jgi:hypothetical protein